MNRFFAFVCAVVLGVVVTGCGSTAAPTKSFVSVNNATALAGLPNGGMRYATRSGDLLDVDNSGKGSAIPVAHIDGATSRGVLGLVVDPTTSLTYASYVDAATNTLRVSTLATGPSEVIYRSTEVASATPGGRMAFSADRRIIFTFTPKDGPSRVMSIDPDRADDQIANVISTNWNDLGGLAYAAGNVLWVIDGNASGDRISRTAAEGSTGRVTNTGTSKEPVALSAYGDTELVVCFAKTGTLQRFLISDGIQALSGRVVSEDCSGDAVQLHDGRLAYITKSEIRVTVI